MSIHTLYDRLLVFHAVGQGKTHTAAAVCEALLYPPTNNISPYKKAYIFTRNNDLKLAFIKKLVLSATNKKYLPDDGDVENMTSGQLTRKLSGKYQFDTFKAFSNHYGEIPKSYIESAKTSTDYVPVEDAKMLENIHQLYDDSVIVIDEVHNLKRELEVYWAFHHLLHTVKNCKVLVMTGTVCQDQPYEHALIMNLLLPIYRQMVATPQAFEKAYMNGNKIKPLQIPILKRFYQGLVSVIRTPTSSIPRVYQTSSSTHNEQIAVCPINMSVFQSETYLKVWKVDAKTDLSTIDVDDPQNNFYKDSIQASNFVFPNSSSGFNAYKNYSITQNVKLAKLGKMSKGKDLPSIKESLRNAITGKNNAERLISLYKFSAKFASTIKEILKGGNTYIYNSEVRGGGCLLFARILEIFGYTRYTGGKLTSKEKRYMVITNETEIGNDFTSQYNLDKNFEGEYIQVVISSRIGSEGLDFFNVQQIHIQTISWNFGVLDQALGRAFRYGSHNAILAKYPNLVVKIFLYATIPIEAQENNLLPSSNDSIDLKLFETSTEKDRKNKPFERLLFESAIDCASNREVNWLLPALDNTRECHYQECRYSCLGIDEYELKEVQKSGWYNFSQTEQEKIKEIIVAYLRLQISASLNKLVEEAKKIITSADLRIVGIVLVKLFNVPLSDRYGFPAYLHQDEDQFFLTSSLVGGNSYLDGYNIQIPIIQAEKSFKNVLELLNEKSNNLWLDEISKSDPTELLYLLSRIQPDIQEYLIEAVMDVYISKVINVASSIKSLLSERQYIIYQYFKKYLLIVSSENTIVSKLLHIARYRLIKPINSVWKNVEDNSTLFLRIAEDKIDLEKKLENNPYGYYAVINYGLWDHAQTNKSIDGFWIYKILAGSSKSYTIEAPDGVSFSGDTIDALFEKIKGQKSPLNKKQLTNLISKKPDSENPPMNKGWKLISKPDFRKELTGQVCGTGIWTVIVLVKLCYELGIDPPAKKPLPSIEIMKAELVKKRLDLPKTTKDLERLYRIFLLARNELCPLLKDWFVEHDLVRTITEKRLRIKKK
jgi:hypothetical protein